MISDIYRLTPAMWVNWVKCSYKSIKGVISSNWELKDGTFHLNLEIPQDAIAKIFIPVQYSKTSCIIKEMNTNNIVNVKINNGGFEIGTGTYQIIAK